MEDMSVCVLLPPFMLVDHSLYPYQPPVVEYKAMMSFIVLVLPQTMSVVYVFREGFYKQALSANLAV